jgi:Mg2+-importing ATPase
MTFRRQPPTNARAGDDASPPWIEKQSDLLARLRSSPAGLTQAEVAARLRRYGPNARASRRRPSALLQLVSRFGNPLVILLVIVSGLSAAVGDFTSFAIIATTIVLSVLLDFIQERRAERTMADLAQSVAVTITALRDGELREVPSETLVPGDIVALEPGDLVPADCRLIETHDLSVNEALLNGEAYPIEKTAVDLTAADLKVHSSVLNASNMVFQATSIQTGSARAVVCRTGSATELAGMVGGLWVRPPATAFALSLARFGHLMLRWTVFIVAFVLIVDAFFGRPLLQSLLFALALAVALAPELLPAIIAVTLARGAQRLAARKVVAKQLPAIHNLGAMDVLCTDKTGTLTEARMELARSVDTSGADAARPAALAFLNSHFSNGVLSPLDTAIVAHDGDASGWIKIDEVPFDYQRRRISLLLERGGKRMLVTKGAPENVLDVCRSWETPEGKNAPLDDAALQRIEDTIATFSRAGYRLLGVAFADQPSDKDVATLADENGLVLAGFLAFRDPPKSTAGATVRALAELGISVKILTGDSELVTRRLCEDVGIPVSGVISGDDLQTMDDAVLLARLDSTNVFCRLAPAAKERVITNLRRRGHTVGYLGDGANDAPALHIADVGLSVDGAASVAREAASVILLEHDLSVVRDGVIEGRRAVENAVKYVLMGTSSNFGNMFSMAGAALFLPILPMLPTQVLLNNLLYDVSELGIPLDNVDQDTLSRPVRWDIGAIRRSMLILGPVSSLFDFLTFFVLFWIFHASAAEFQTGWFVESLATQTLVIFAIRSRLPLRRSRPNGILAALTIGVVAIAALMPLSPVGHWFGFVTLPLGYYGFLAAATVAYLALVEVLKPLVFGVPASTEKQQ